MMKPLLFVLFSLIVSSMYGQVFQYNNWCHSKCDAAGDEMANTKAIFMKRNSSAKGLTGDFLSKKTFPLKIFLVNKEGAASDTDVEKVKRTIGYLNESFRESLLSFSINEISSIKKDLYIEDLMANGYEPYLQFSSEHDSPDYISVYVFDVGKDLCTTTSTSIQCGRTGGFSFILSAVTNNIVLSKFDLEDHKILTHEMGHFFGLYHTFEEVQFGKDDFVGDCNVLGDCLCDTPPDPGPAYEVYVNYSLCEMKDHKFNETYEYKPLLNNYMSYYKPCYLKEYEFTNGQIEVLNYAANSDLRVKFSH